MKTNFFLFVLILTAVFGCDNAGVIPGTGTSPVFTVSTEPFDLKFSGNASDSVMKAVTPAWYIYSFDLPYFSPFEVHPSDIMLKENTAKSETFSYEWITVSKTDSMLRVSVTENTSDTVRTIRVILMGDPIKDAIALGQYVYVTQQPKIKE